MKSKPIGLPRDPAPAPPLEVLAARREQLIDRIGDGVAVVPAAPEYRRSRDTEAPYRASSDLFYLTGFLEPESCAVLTPHDDDHRFTLFVRPRDPKSEAWTGERIGVDRAGELFGADAVYPIAELSERLPELLKAADYIHYPVDALAELDTLILEALLLGRMSRPRTGRGPVGIVDLEATTGAMRVLKDSSELDRMRIAAAIGAAGHVAAMQVTRPGMGEWEVQAALEAAFLANGAAPPAFQSIVGAGVNATVLHYVSNRSRIDEGDLVLIDAGAEWGMYCSDITRTFPASGRFSSAQRDLYEVVLAAEEAAIAASIPGNAFSEVHDAAVDILAQGMLDLGILEGDSLDEVVETGAFRKFYMHQTSHWLGLDVHDAGPYRDDEAEPVRLQPGMVLTVEPGIYIPADAENVPEVFRGVGIRIEDNVIITAQGQEVITRGAPVQVEEIEAMMAR